MRKISVPLVFVCTFSILLYLYISAGAALIFISFLLSYILLTNLKPFESLSKVALAIISICFYVLILQFICIGTWAINHNFLLSTNIIVATLVLGATNLLFLRKKRIPLGIRRMIHATDTTALLLSFVFIVLIVGSVLAKFGGLPQNAVTGFVDGNVDDGAHIGAVNDRIDYNRAIFFHSNQSENIRSGAMSGGAYPSGWHAVNGALIRAFAPKITIGTGTLWAFVITKLLWYWILLFVFFTVCLQAIKTFNVKATLEQYAVGSALAVLAALYIMVDFYRLGFYPFFPQLIAILIGILALLQKTAADDPRRTPETFFILSIFAIGGGLSWLLILPLMCVFLAIVYSLEVGLNKKKLSSFIRSSAAFTPIYACILIAAIIQLYIVKSAQSVTNIVDYLNLYGNIAIYTQSLILTITVGAFAALAWHSPIKKKFRQILFIYLLLLLIFAVIIYAVQLLSVEKISYYFYKTLDIFLVAAVPFAITGFTIWIARLRAYGAPYGVSLAGVGALIVIIGFPAGNSPTVSYLYGKLGLTPTESKMAYESIRDQSASMIKSNGKPSYVFYFNSKRPQETDIANMLLKTVPHDGYCYNAIRPSFTDGTTVHDIASILRRVCSNNNISIITDRQTASSLQNEIQSQEISNITIRSTD